MPGNDAAPPKNVLRRVITIGQVEGSGAEPRDGFDAEL